MKTVMLKCCCSFSLAKLIASCSARGPGGGVGEEGQRRRQRAGHTAEVTGRSRSRLLERVGLEGLEAEDVEHAEEGQLALVALARGRERLRRGAEREALVDRGDQVVEEPLVQRLGNGASGALSQGTHARSGGGRGGKQRRAFESASTCSTASRAVSCFLIHSRPTLSRRAVVAIRMSSTSHPSSWHPHPRLSLDESCAASIPRKSCASTRPEARSKGEPPHRGPTEASRRSGAAVGGGGGGWRRRVGARGCRGAAGRPAR